jgi:hypothetical protein
VTDLAVIIVSFNSADLLARTLASVLEQGEGLRHEIIVVDNASTDGTPEMVRERFPTVRLICNEENVGFAAANNQAIRQTQSPYVALLNPDAWLLNDALGLMQAYLQQHPQVGLVGPRMQDAAGRPLASAHAFADLATVLLSLCGCHRVLPASWRDRLARLLGRRGRTYGENFAAAEPVAVDWLCGACVLARREAIEQVGLLDEGYHMYLEDEDWCRRLARAGWQVVYLPQASIVHAVQHGRPPTAAMVRFRYDSSRRYHRRYHPLTYSLIWVLLTIRYLRDRHRARRRRLEGAEPCAS